MKRRLLLKLKVITNNGEKRKENTNLKKGQHRGQQWLLKSFIRFLIQFLNLNEETKLFKLFLPDYLRCIYVLYKNRP